MQLRGIALYPRVDSELEADSEFLIFEFEPLRVDQSRLGIDRRHTNTTGRQESSDLRPQLSGCHIHQRPSLTGKALYTNRIRLIIGR